MLGAGKWVMAIVAGGISLGALLGAAADPDMKEPPQPWWRLTGTEAIAVEDQSFGEAWPEDLNPFTGYRPDLDYDAVVWALPIPEYDLAALAEEPFVPAYDEWPSVTYGVTVEEVADDAEEVAEQAVAAQATEAEPEAAAATGPAADEAPQPELAGLY